MASFGNVSLEHAKDDRASFVLFIKKAVDDHESPEFVELRRFLMDCFVDVDRDFDGMATREDFDTLVEKAGNLPRKWGFAPTTEEMFATEEAKKSWRDQAFKEVNKSGTGTIPIDEWVNWCLEHIVLKAKLLSTQYATSKMKTNAEDFKYWICSAAKTRHCPEYKELYHFPSGLLHKGRSLSVRPHWPGGVRRDDRDRGCSSSEVWVCTFFGADVSHCCAPPGSPCTDVQGDGLPQSRLHRLRRVVKLLLLPHL